MAPDRSAWNDGRSRWERLASWHGRLQFEGSGGGGERALSALADIGQLRRLLDQTELSAVRAARGYRKSWAEIATQLGVTRQSAWERWRDLDETPAETQGEMDRDTHDETLVTVDLADEQRMPTVTVPNVIGLSWDSARDALRRARLVGVGPDPVGPPLAALRGPDVVVTDQSPESGARVEPESPVILWTERGGGSGVREPRRPNPIPLQAREMHDEPSEYQSDSAVG